MKLQDKLQDLAVHLVTVNAATYHDMRPPNITDKFIVWEEGPEATALTADGHKVLQKIDVYVHYFTTEEFDPKFDEIQTMIDSLSYVRSWELTSVQNGDPEIAEDTLKHYMWTLGVA